MFIIYNKLINLIKILIMTRCKGKLDNGILCSVKNAKFGLPGGKAEYCKPCALKENKGMVDVINKKCITCIDLKINPPTQATYNLAGHPPVYCGKHYDKETMILVTHKKCIDPGCTFEPYFNFHGLKPKYCSKHCITGMIDLRMKKCIDCPIENVTAPCFNYPDIKKPEYCFLHKKPGMVSKLAKVCSFPNCDTNKNGYYGYKNKFDTVYCVEHKKNDMINLSHVICVKCNKTCAIYGIPGKTPSHCGACSLTEKNMVKRSGSGCKGYKNCRDDVVYGKNRTLLHCVNHKDDDEIMLGYQTCKSCNLDAILNEKDFCETCDPNKIKIVMLAKQNALQTALELHGLKFTSVDKIIDNGICGKERPDFIFDMYKFILILECDEHQHKDRQLTCETTRMINIGQSYGGIPVYFIRWNPDDYKPFNEIKNTKMISINNRYKTVINFIKDIQNDTHKLPTDSLVSAIYMYYDGWINFENTKWISITKFETDITV